LTKAGQSLVGDPVTAFALGTIPALLKLNQGSKIGLSFIADQKNLQAFLNNQAHYVIKQSPAVISDYSKMETPRSGRLYLGLDNSGNILMSKMVTVKVVAVRIVNRYEEKELKEMKISEVKFPEL
jgi:hypothetical protein